MVAAGVQVVPGVSGRLWAAPRRLWEVSGWLFVGPIIRANKVSRMNRVRITISVRVRVRFRLGLAYYAEFLRSLHIAGLRFSFGSGYGHDRRVSSLGCYWYDGRFPYILHCGHDRHVSSTWPLRYVKIRFFLSVMPQKTQLLFLIYPHKKKPSFDKVWTYYRILVSKRVKGGKQEKKKLAYPRTPLPCLRINFFHYCDTAFLWVQQNARKEYNHYCVG